MGGGAPEAPATASERILSAGSRGGREEPSRKDPRPDRER